MLWFASEQYRSQSANDPRIRCVLKMKMETNKPMLATLDADIEQNFEEAKNVDVYKVRSAQWFNQSVQSIQN